MVELIESELRADAREPRRVRAEIAARRRAPDAARGGGDAGGDQVRRARRPAGARRAGVVLVGENRAQDLEAKVAAHGELFAWDFIGQLQSRRVRAIVPHVRLIHSVASESALRELDRHREHARAGLRDPDRGQRRRASPARPASRPEQLEGFIERSPLPVAGLMTMPPLRRRPEREPPLVCRAARAGATQHGLRELSMGTSQDYPVAVAGGRDDRADRRETVRLDFSGSPPARRAANALA